MPTDPEELSFGEKAVWIKFNPSNDDAVHLIKTRYAEIINHLNDSRNSTDDGEQKRLLSVAITEAQGAQMWAVKAVTWLYNK